MRRKISDCKTKRERKTRDETWVKCIKDENKKVLIREDVIKERWRSYFDKLFDAKHANGLGYLTSSIED